MSGLGHTLARDFTHAGVVKDKRRQRALGVGDADQDLAMVGLMTGQQPDAAFSIDQARCPCGISGGKGSRFPLDHHSVSALAAAR